MPKFTFKSTDLTPTFSYDIKPEHVGVYYDSGLNEFMFWDGDQWGCYQSSIEDALNKPDFKNAAQSKKWCGLRFNPNGGENG
jgi:hypothetical protein